MTQGRSALLPPHAGTGPLLGTDNLLAYSTSSDSVSGFTSINHARGWPPSRRG
jgi:hypothetical protein